MVKMCNLHKISCQQALPNIVVVIGAAKISGAQSKIKFMHDRDKMSPNIVSRSEHSLIYKVPFAPPSRISICNIMLYRLLEVNIVIYV